MKEPYTVLEYDQDKGVTLLHRVEVVNASSIGEAEEICRELWNPREWGVGGAKAFKGTPSEAFTEFLEYASHYKTPFNRTVGGFGSDDITPLSKMMVDQYLERTGLSMDEPEILAQMI